jgi:L-threonylcarbamoyladenylate synthase
MDYTTALNYDEILSVANVLRKGQVILFPSDTLWGLGCDMTNQSAVKRITEIKNQTPDKPPIILVESLATLKSFVPNLHPRIETLLSYHTQPLTLVYNDVEDIPEYLIADNGTVAIRICLNPFCQSVIKEFGRPIVYTSANKSGEKFPASFQEVNNFMLKESDYIVEYGQEQTAEMRPSVMARYNVKGELEFLRE